MRSSYGCRGLAGDAAGGTVAALIALPYGLVMAQLMGLPPALGLFTSILRDDTAGSTPQMPMPTPSSALMESPTSVPGRLERR